MSSKEREAEDEDGDALPADIDVHIANLERQLDELHNKKHSLFDQLKSAISADAKKKKEDSERKLEEAKRSVVSETAMRAVRVRTELRTLCGQHFSDFQWYVYFV